MALSPKQIAAAELLADPSYHGTLKQIAKEAGVTTKTLWMWRTTDNEFIERVDRRVTELVRNDLRRDAYKCLAKNIARGDRASAQNALQACGDIGSGGSTQVVNVTQHNDTAEDRIKAIWADRLAITTEDDG